MRVTDRNVLGKSDPVASVIDALQTVDILSNASAACGGIHVFNASKDCKPQRVEVALMFKLGCVAFAYLHVSRWAVGADVLKACEEPAAASPEASFFPQCFGISSELVRTHALAEIKRLFIVLHSA
jgi:hypothetical protein